MTATHVVSPSGFPLVALLGKVAAQTGMSVGNLVTVSPEVIVWGRVKTALPYFSVIYFLKIAFSSLSSLELSSSCLARQAFASVSVVTTLRSAAVAMARFSKAPMVASSI
jgi:hypothetical protein